MNSKVKSILEGKSVREVIIDEASDKIMKELVSYLTGAIPHSKSAADKLQRNISSLVDIIADKPVIVGAGKEYLLYNSLNL